MATKPQIKVTPEMIAAVIGSVSVEDLAKAATDRKMETVKEEIDIYLKTEGEQLQRLARIQSVNPEWKPPTVSDKIVSFITEKGASTPSEIGAGIGVKSPLEETR